jgi:hypothetical protein
MSANLKDAQAAKSRAAKVFGELVGDVAVGLVKLGDDQFGLKVNLTEQPSANLALPDNIDGVPVQVEVVGHIRKR